MHDIFSPTFASTRSVKARMWLWAYFEFILEMTKYSKFDHSMLTQSP